MPPSEEGTVSNGGPAIVMDVEVSDPPATVDAAETEIKTNLLRRLSSKRKAVPKRLSSSHSEAQGISPKIKAVPMSNGLTVAIPSPDPLDPLQSQQISATSTATPGTARQPITATLLSPTQEQSELTTHPTGAAAEAISARTRLRRFLHRPHRSDGTHTTSKPGVLDALSGSGPSSPLANRMIGAEAVAPSFQTESGEAVQVPLLTTLPVEDVLDELTPHATESGSGIGINGGVGSPSSPAKLSTLPAVPVVVQSTAEVKSVAVALSTDNIPLVQQKPNIKVRIITWNMHDSVPKGDLEILLGKVGPYIAPEPGWDAAANSDSESETGDGDEVAGENKIPQDPLEEEARRRAMQSKDERRRRRGKAVVGQESTRRKDRIPPLPYDDKHPYHVLLVAGQECPWGDGNRLATSMGLATELGDLSRSKSKAVNGKKEKRDEGDEQQPPRSANSYESTDKVTSFDFAKLPTSITAGSGTAPPTPGLDGSSEFIASSSGGGGSKQNQTIKGWGGKGWSDMCEEWYCRGLGNENEPPMSGLLGSSRGADSVTDSAPATPSIEIPSSGGSAAVAAVQMSMSPPKGRAKDGFSLFDGAMLSVPTPPFLKRNKSDMSLSDGAAAAGHAALAAGPRTSSEDSADASGGSNEGRRTGLQVKIPYDVRLQPTTSEDGTPLSLGPYELVIKERMMGCYLACYVWRGCLDRVQGVSRGHVKSGLLSGRVGNKGGCGVSLKLGETRLLFVNTHLAAHEGRVAARIANVQKIKTELALDTFLPKDDPRNELRDITAKFDHTFWCGDLNFRVEITRRHADWLMMNKRYDDALEFDQLRKILRDPKSVFEGFAEAPIAFPPTFKFDVIKTVKMRRGRPMRRTLVQNSSQGNKSGDESMLRTSSVTSSEIKADDAAALAACRDADMASLSSISGSLPSLSGGEEMVCALSGTEGDLFTRDDIVSPNMGSKAATASAESGRKTRPPALKRILRLVKGFKGDESGDEPRSPFLTRLPSASLPSFPNMRSANFAPPEEWGDNSDAGSVNTDDGAREQPYDTSAKQRVPSWCDRVLWRSTVEEEDPSKATVDGIGRRVSAAWANAIHSNRVRQASLAAAHNEPAADAPANATEDTPAAKFPRSVTFDEHVKGGKNASAFPLRLPNSRRSSAGDMSAVEKTTEPRGRRTSLSLVVKRPWGLARSRSTEASVATRDDDVTPVNEELPSNSSTDVRKKTTARSLSMSILPTETDLVRKDVTGPSSWWSEHITPLLTALRQDTTSNANDGSNSAGFRKLSFALPWILGDSDASNVPQLVGPDRGKVECLQYSSLTDAEMRQLEGRSDHRPVIFVGSIGI